MSTPSASSILPAEESAEDSIGRPEPGSADLVRRLHEAEVRLAIECAVSRILGLAVTELSDERDLDEP